MGHGRYSAKVPEERANFLRQEFRLLEGREMAALLHHAPAADVLKHQLCRAARWSDRLARELCVTGRHLDGGAWRQYDRAVMPGIIGPEGRADCAAEPIERDI